MLHGAPPEACAESPAGAAAAPSAHDGQLPAMRHSVAPFATTDGTARTSLADCICEPGRFALWTNATLSCVVCPVGANLG